RAEGLAYSAIMKATGVPKSLIRMWSSKSPEDLVRSLEMKRTGRRGHYKNYHPKPVVKRRTLYPPEVHARAVELYRSGLSIWRVEKALDGPSFKTVYDWVLAAGANRTRSEAQHYTRKPVVTPKAVVTLKPLVIPKPIVSKP